MVRRLFWDAKVPGTSVGTRAAAAPGPAPAWSATEFLDESQVNSSLPCQTGMFEQHQVTWMRDVAEGNKDEVANTQGQCAPPGTVDTGWEELGPEGP